MTALDSAAIEQSFDLGERFDDDADVFVLIGETVYAGSHRRIHATAIEPDTLVRATVRRHISLDRDEIADQPETGFLLGLTDRHRFGCLDRIDQPGYRLDLPRRAAGDQRR